MDTRGQGEPSGIVSGSGGGASVQGQPVLPAHPVERFLPLDLFQPNEFVFHFRFLSGGGGSKNSEQNRHGQSCHRRALVSSGSWVLRITSREVFVP